MKVSVYFEQDVHGFFCLFVCLFILSFMSSLRHDRNESECVLGDVKFPVKFWLILPCGVFCFVFVICCLFVLFCSLVCVCVFLFVCFF